MELRLLGAFDVHDGATSVVLGGSRQRAVLLALALRANEVVPLERLVDDVWDGEPPATATGTLQRYVSHLRQALVGLPAQIETRKPGYVLVIDPEHIDARRFERLASEGRALLAAEDPGGASLRLAEALACWRGPAIADFCDEPFARPDAVRLDELRQVCVEDRVASELALGRAREVLPELEALVEADPLRESLRALLMRALHASGRRADALRTFADGRRVLGEELGLDPSREIQRLEEAILLQDPSVEPRTRSAPAGNLPLEVDRFIGRDTEFGVLGAVLDRSRVVTLTGPGGSGKTRLALHAAHRRAALHDGGAWFVELAPVRDPALVVTALASTLGVRDEGDGPLLDAVLASLRERSCLLVLDNCEHVLDAAAAVVARVLRECARVQILATSRSPLDVSGETAWSVPPLADDDAVRLFAERAEAAFPSFSLSGETGALVADVCRRLDGIPLAIELAAARLRVLSLAELAARLHDRFALLTAGARDADDRQRTLRATVEWSYDLLGDGERALFDRLSVFVGAFDVCAVEAVATGGIVAPADALDLLGALVAKSLVGRIDDGSGVAQYRLLETLRHFGAERLEASGEAGAIATRHAQWCTSAVEEAVGALEGPRALLALSRLEAIHDDCRAALARLVDTGDSDGALMLAGALWPFWDYRFYVGEGRASLERALALDGGSDDARLGALVGLTQLAYLDDDPERACSACDEAMALAATRRDRVTEGRLLTIRADIARQHDADPLVARHLAEAARTVVAEVGDAWWEAQAMRVLTLVAWDAGEFDRAEALALGCLDRWERCGDHERMAGVTAMRAGIARDRGDLETAERLFEESLEAFRLAGEPAGAALSLRSLGTVAWLRGDAQRALALGEESRRVHEDLGHRRGTADSLHLIGQALLDLGDVEQAARFCEDALARFRERGFGADVVAGLLSVARVALSRGDLAAAAGHCEEALGPYRTQGVKLHAGAALSLLADVRAAEGDPAAAVALLEESITVYAGTGDKLGMDRSLDALRTLTPVS